MNIETSASVIALSRLKGVDCDLMSLLQEKGIGASDFLAMSPSERGAACSLDQMPRWEEREINDALETGRREAEFCTRHNIRILSPILDNYPRRAAILSDSPTVLFVLGNADLDALHILSIVGTRRITPMGESFCRKFVADLANLKTNPLIISGLAYGVDACAHGASLDNNLPTVAVLAHGLSMVYPAAHRGLAERIISCGGALVTRYLSDEKPFRGHFLERNRVIAALADGVMVVESAVKGGAMNTAHAAFEYDRSVMAMPGRTSDSMSEGCNQLIRKNIAVLTGDARQACDTLGWEIDREAPSSPSLFREPEKELMPVYSVLRDFGEPMGIDHLMMRCGIGAARISAMLFQLEEEGFVTRVPNNRYILT